MTRTDAKRLKLTKTLEEVHALADRVLSAARAASRRPPRVRAPGPTKEAKREEHRASTGELREAVWERCGGVASWPVCVSRAEWCEANPKPGREKVKRGAFEWTEAPAGRDVA